MERARHRPVRCFEGTRRVGGLPAPLQVTKELDEARKAKVSRAGRGEREKYRLPL